jgi:hypothetical protein
VVIIFFFFPSPAFLPRRKTVASRAAGTFPAYKLAVFETLTPPGWNSRFVFCLFFGALGFTFVLFLLLYFWF